MNIDRVATTTMLVFSSFILDSFFFKQKQQQLLYYRRLIQTYLNSVTATRTHIFFYFLSFFSSFSHSIVSLYSLLLVCVELAMYKCAFVCMLLTIVEKNLCIFLYTIVVLPFIRPILLCIPVFFS